MTTEVEELIAILDHERQCLLHGRYDDLNDKNNRKEQLLARLEDEPPDEAALLELQSVVARLQAMSEAAIRGVRETRAELDRSLEARTRLATYGPGGDARCITFEQPVLTRRA